MIRQEIYFIFDEFSFLQTVFLTYMRNMYYESNGYGSLYSTKNSLNPSQAE